MKRVNLLKILIIIGVVVFNLKAYAGAPEDETIIIFQSENQVKFKVQDQNQSTISQALYFKVSTEPNATVLTALHCQLDYCNYAIPTTGLPAGIYQIQVYIEGYTEPATKSFVID